MFQVIIWQGGQDYFQCYHLCFHKVGSSDEAMGSLNEDDTQRREPRSVAKIQIPCQDEVTLKVERIGEAKKPGPGRFRTHRRGRRSVEAEATRRTRFFQSTEFIAGLCVDDQSADEEIKTETVHPQDLCVWHVNVQGLRSHVAELVARLRMSEHSPHLLSLNETFLDQSVGEVEIEGYVISARWDRSIQRG